MERTTLIINSKEQNQLQNRGMDRNGIPKIPMKRRRRMQEASGSTPRFTNRKSVMGVSGLIVLALGLRAYPSGDYTTYDMGYLTGGYLTGESYNSLTGGLLAGASSSSLSSFDPDANEQTMNVWRTEVEQNCKTVLENNNKMDGPVPRKQKEELEREALSKIVFPPSVTGALPSGHQPYKFCRNVFIDLGTNIGDSVGYFVDSALDACTATWLDALPKTKLTADFPRPHLDVTSLQIVHEGTGSNPLYGMIQKHLRETNPPQSPHSFCVYGMEGNPEFTERLQKLENHVMQAQPRPVQHLHIHTESVITAVDGPTKLYLDKTSVKENVSVPLRVRFVLSCCGWSWR